MAEYLVTVKDASTLDEFYADMEFRGYTRTIRRPTSRSTGYELTDEQVEEVKRDSRVLDIELRDPPNVVTKLLGAVNYEPYPILGDFTKTSVSSSTESDQRQWGHVSHAGTTAQRSYGNTPGTVDYTTWNSGTVNERVDVFSNGKHVDIVICDSPVGPDHAEWISEETGLSRFVEYDWYAEHNAQVIGGLDSDGLSSPGSNYTYANATALGQEAYHGTHVMSTAGGRHYGWAKEANLYNINLFPTAVSGQTQMSTELMFDYIRAFHRNKPINPVTGFKNPTIVNCSYSSGYDLSETYPSGVQSNNIYGVYHKGELYDDGVTAYDGNAGTTPVGMKGVMSTWGSTDIRRIFGIYGYDFPYYSTSNGADLEDCIADGVVICKAQGNDDSPRSGDHHKNAGTLYSNDGNMRENIVWLDNGWALRYCRVENPYAPGVISVGALTTIVNYTSSNAYPAYGSIPVSFSNRGIDTHVWAAGTIVTGAYPPASGGVQDTKPGYVSGIDFFKSISGTSMASPQVCGVLACYATGRERFNSADAHRYLQKTSNKTEMFTDNWAKNYPSTTRKTHPITISADPTNLTVLGQDRRSNLYYLTTGDIRVEALDTINFTLPTTESHKFRLVKGSSNGLTNTDIDDPSQFPHQIIASESIPASQTEYVTAGTYSWTCPVGVTSVCVVCVGGGGGSNNGGSPGNDYSQGGGGGLGWKNNIPVTPGQSYTVVVGAAGQFGSPSGTDGGDSYFINATTVKGGGGLVVGTGGSRVGDGGGIGGNSGGIDQPNQSGGGGGAGGYAGRGGDGGSAGNNNTGGAGSGGGGGGGGASSNGTSGGGGGVGIYGQGSDGTAGVNGTGGGGGSGGNDGRYSVGSGGQPTDPGQFGGGADRQGNGGGGAVRIIWGSGRAYPSTNTANQTVAAGTMSWTPTIDDVGYYWLTCGCSLQPNHDGVANAHTNRNEVKILVEPPACWDDMMAGGGSSNHLLQATNTRPTSGMMGEWCHDKGNRWGLGRAGYYLDHRGDIRNRILVTDYGNGEFIWPRQNTLNRGVPSSAYYSTTITHPDGSDFKVYGNANDSEGNLYVVGSIHVAQTTPGSGIDGIIYKLDQAGNVVKSVQYDPATNSSTCHFNGVVVDDDDYIYVHATSSVVIKFNTELVEQWQTQTLHGNGYGNISQDNIDNGGSIMQSSSSIIIAGYGYSGWHVHTVNKSDGQATASTYGGTNGQTMFYGANVTGGQMYFCGWHSNGHPSDYFWAIAGSNGTSSSHQFYNVGSNAVARCIAKDTTNNRTYIAGDMGGKATIMRFDTYNTNTTGQGSVWWKESTSTQDIMDIALDRDHNPVFVNGGNVTKIDEWGNVLWTKSTGGGIANKIRIDSDNNMWITCNNSSSSAINVIKAPASGVGLTTVTDLTLTTRSYQHQDYGQITTGFAFGSTNGMSQWGNISSNAAGGFFSNFTPTESNSTLAAPGEKGYIASGESVYDYPGSYQWICPVGVYQVSVVCVGGGGAGSGDGHSSTGGAGGGGGLGYKNAIDVTPGQTYTVTVGNVAAGGGGGNGGDSYFIDATTVKGEGGDGDSGATGGNGGSWQGDGGGNGGKGGNAGVGSYEAGGGGAGGYGGQGGDGGFGNGSTHPDSTAISDRQGDDGTNGGGGGGGYGGGYTGGGVGLYGRGKNGRGGAYQPPEGVPFGTGEAGSAQTGSSYGGGGSGAGAEGGKGAVRIMWGPNRSFPTDAAKLT